MKKTTLLLSLIFTLILCSCKENQQITEITESSQPNFDITITSEKTTEESTVMSSEKNADNIPPVHSYPVLKNIDWKKYLGEAAAFMNYDWHSQISNTLAGGTPNDSVEFELMDIDADGIYEMLLYNRSQLHADGGVFIYKVVNDNVVNIGSYSAVVDYRKCYNSTDDIDLLFKTPEYYCDVYTNADGAVRFTALNYWYNGSGAYFSYTINELAESGVKTCNEFLACYNPDYAVEMGAEPVEYYTDSMDEGNIITEDSMKKQIKAALYGWTKAEILPPIDLPEAFSMNYYWQIGSIDNPMITEYADKETANNNFVFGFAKTFGLIQPIYNISENKINYGSKKIKVNVEMIDGTVENRTVGDHTKNLFTGSFEIVTYNTDDSVLDRLYLNNFIPGTDNFFYNQFSLAFDDYNGDGNYDFTIGQIVADNSSDYKIYSLNEVGEISQIYCAGSITSRIYAEGEEPSVHLYKEDDNSFSSTWDSSSHSYYDEYLDEDALKEWLKTHNSIDYIQDYYIYNDFESSFERQKSVPVKKTSGDDLSEIK